MEAVTEKNLVEEFKGLRASKTNLENQLKEVTQEIEKTKASLIESLEARNAQATAKYEGVGYVSLAKPRLYASYDKENEQKVFDYLEHEGRGDLIKQTVHHKSLASFVGESIENGKNMPNYLKYYLQPDLRFYAA